MTHTTEHELCVGQYDKVEHFKVELPIHAMFGCAKVF